MDIHRYRNSCSLNHEQTAAVKVKKSDNPLAASLGEKEFPDSSKTSSVNKAVILALLEMDMLKSF